MHNHKTILVIAPHPDDEVLGVGGTIRKFIQDGSRVHVCIMTKPYQPAWAPRTIAKKEQEVLRVSKLLHVTSLIRLDFPAAKLDSIPECDIIDKLVRIVSSIKPDMVFIPSPGDLHLDHRIVYEAALVALRPFQFNVQSVYAYETLSETEWGAPLTRFSPNVYINISKTLSDKIKAMKAYRSELKSFPHPRSITGIKALAMKRGTEVHFLAAEAFQLIWERNT